MNEVRELLLCDSKVFVRLPDELNVGVPYKRVEVRVDHLQGLSQRGSKSLAPAALMHLRSMPGFCVQDHKFDSIPGQS